MCIDLQWLARNIISIYRDCILAHLYTNGPASVVRPSSVRPSVRPSVVRRRPQCSKIFFSETAGPIKAKFYVEPPWVGGTLFCSRHLGHMTKMAATPIYGKNIIVCSNDDPGVTLTYFTARSNLET